MRIVVHDASGKMLGVEHIDGTHWIVRDDKFLCLDRIDVLIRRSGIVSGFVLMNNAGKIINRGGKVKTELPMEVTSGQIFYFRPQALTFTVLEHEQQC